QITFIIIIICLISSQLNLSKLHINALVLTNNEYYYHKHRPSTIYLQLTNQHKQFYHTNHLMNWFNQQINNQYLSTNSIINNDHSISNNNNDQQLQQQYIIEKYKKKILLQLHMNTVPNVNVNNQSEWNSLPIVLRNRIKNEIDTTNHLINNKLIEHDEEKETLILLKQYQSSMKLPASNIFTLKVAEVIDPIHINRVTLHVEINDDVHSNVQLTCWELQPTLFKQNPSWYNEDNNINDVDDVDVNDIDDVTAADATAADDNDDNDDDDVNVDDNDITLTSLTQSTLNDYNTLEDYQKLHTSNLLNIPTSFYSSLPNEQLKQRFKIIKPQIANSLLSDDHYSSVLTFNLTQRMITWLNYYAINNIHQPLIRYLLITCNNCNNEQNIINPKKVVLEIRYRPSLQRTKRSLTKGDETISNVCRSNGHHYSCCTQPLSVKFSDIGWDNWIIHPKSFEPNYCRGSCKVTSTKSLHYDVMDLLLRKNLTQFSNIQRDEVQSCCHPTQLTSMSVLYLDSNRELQMHTLHNLIVLGCGCS
ncbi:Inhibin beta A chain, partial [Schistosoma japonicum]